MTDATVSSPYDPGMWLQIGCHSSVGVINIVIKKTTDVFRVVGSVTLSRLSIMRTGPRVPGERPIRLMRVSIWPIRKTGS